MEKQVELNSYSQKNKNLLIANFFLKSYISYRLYFNEKVKFMRKIAKSIVAIIYGIGVAIVFVLLTIILFQSHIVVFPNAMLPMELRELASIWLAMGFIPMMIFSILFHKVFEISKSNHKKRNTILTYIPTVICLLCLVFWLCTLVIGMINTMNHMVLK